MQLGSFWGMTAPMMVMAFDGQYGKLFSFLDVLNTSVNRCFLDDICLEFQALRAAVGSGVYRTADVDAVSAELSPFTMITDGCVAGKGDFYNQRLLAEFCNNFLACVITADSRGKFYTIPEDLPGFVKSVLAGKSVKLNEIPKILRRAVKTLPEAASSTLDSVAGRYHLTVKAPDVCYRGSEQIILSEEAKSVWEYFYNRADVIETVIDRCSGKAMTEEITFGVSFFDMVKRKPLSLKYKVIEIFDRAKERQTAHLVSKCIGECAAELKKYKECLMKYVDNPRYCSGAEDSSMLPGDFQEVLAGAGGECVAFFNSLAKAGKFKYYEYTREHFQMLVEIWQRVTSLDPDAVLGCKSSSSVAEEVCIFGINYYGVELLEDAIGCISLTNKSKVKKDDEDLDAIEGILDDVQALLDTLIPVGDLL